MLELKETNIFLDNLEMKRLSRQCIVRWIDRLLDRRLIGIIFPPLRFV